MATTVTYKGATLTAVENATKTLQTKGTWCEDDFTLTDVTQGGGGGLTKLATFTVEEARAVKIDIDPTWITTYTTLLIVPDLVLSSRDWIYIIGDATSGGSYINEEITSFDAKLATVVWTIAKLKTGYQYTLPRFTRDSTNLNPSPLSGGVIDYLYYYTYTASKTMTGTMTVYGVAL